MNKRLQGKAALVTGGGSWIGKAIAERFAKEGASVFVVGRDASKLQATVAEIQHLGGSASWGVADLSNPSEVDLVAKQAIAELGGIDILVQNAGIYPSATLDKMTHQAWQHVIDVNLSGSFHIFKAVMPSLTQRQNGRVIFISSIAGEEVGYSGYAHYAASKAGLNGLMRTAALELGKHNITVNSIDPGNILNLDAMSYSADEVRDMLKCIPIGRAGKPEDVANLALFLASEESGFLTGQNIILDGGEVIN